MLFVDKKQSTATGQPVFLRVEINKKSLGLRGKTRFAAASVLKTRAASLFQ
jgi:hypothetical protein